MRRYKQAPRGYFILKRMVPESLKYLNSFILLVIVIIDRNLMDLNKSFLMKGFLLIAVSLYATASVAQNKNDDDKKFSLGYNYGVSYPESDFGKTNQSKLPMSRLLGKDTTKLSGYAQKGFHYDLYASYRFIPHFSLIIAVYGDQNSYDINTLNSQYISLYPPNTVAVVTGDNYYIVQYLIGPYINIPILKRFSTEIKVLGGFTTANYPSLTYVGLLQDLLYSIPASSGIGYNIGMGFKYMAVKTREVQLGLHLDVDYAGSSITYPSYSVTEYTPADVYISSATYNVPKTMSINIFQFTYGISLEFLN